MRSSLIIILFVTILFGGGYFYYIAQAICPAPLEYSIGEIDESFNLTQDDVRLALSDAEDVWENLVGQNLFIYNPDALFTVNFIYDERQAIADAEGDFKEKLDKTVSVSDAINEKYAQLVAHYNELQIVYSNQVKTYDRNLAAYNKQVTQYNNEGGVPEKLYGALQERKVDLDTQHERLNALSDNLNELVREINEIGEQGNVLVETYNKGVKEYNHTFGESREFTQGTYSSEGRIDIYTYEDITELSLVLAHELGHALSLDHVANEESIMYFLIGEQSRDLEPTAEDHDEFIRVCSTQTLWDTIQTSLFGT